MSSISDSKFKSDFNESHEKKRPKRGNGCWSHVRHFVAAMILLATFNLYMCRINISEAIVAMSKIKKLKSGGSNLTDVCYDPDPEIYLANSTTDHINAKGEFNWDEKDQDIILGAFFYGYISFQVVGGRLAEIFGAKWMCAGGLSMSIIINALTPTIARKAPYYVFLGSRVVLGMFQAFIFPSCYALISRWAPDHERSTLLSLTSIGGNIGTIATSALSGYLSEHGFAGGWPSVFYTSAGIATVWLIVWSIFIESEPKDHRWISHHELKYIESNVGSKNSSDKRRSVPWFKIFTSMPVLAAIVTKFAYTWNYSLLLLKLPAYLQTVFNYSATDNGLITSMVYVVITISLFASGYVSDIFVQKELLHKTKLRKIFQSFATIGTAICMAAIPLAGCNRTAVVAILLFGMFLFGMNAGGDIPVITDMTNNFAATVFAVTNTVAFSTGVITPLFVGVIVEASKQARRQWGYVFYISAAINALGGLFFLVFGSADKQHWDKNENDNMEDHPNYVHRI